MLRQRTPNANTFYGVLSGGGKIVPNEAFADIKKGTKDRECTEPANISETRNS